MTLLQLLVDLERVTLQLAHAERRLEELEEHSQLLAGTPFARDVARSIEQLRTVVGALTEERDRLVWRVGERKAEPPSAC